MRKNFGREKKISGMRKIFGREKKFSGVWKNFGRKKIQPRLSSGLLNLCRFCSSTQLAGSKFEPRFSAEREPLGTWGEFGGILANREVCRFLKRRRNSRVHFESRRFCRRREPLKTWGKILNGNSSSEVAKKFSAGQRRLEDSQKETRPADQALRESFPFSESFKATNVEIYMTLRASAAGRDYMGGTNSSRVQFASERSSRRDSK